MHYLNGQFQFVDISELERSFNIVSFRCFSLSNRFFSLFFTFVIHGWNVTEWEIMVNFKSMCLIILCKFYRIVWI